MNGDNGEVVANLAMSCVGHSVNDAAIFEVSCWVSRHSPLFISLIKQGFILTSLRSKHFVRKINPLPSMHLLRIASRPTLGLKSLRMINLSPFGMPTRFLF